MIYVVLLLLLVLVILIIARNSISQKYHVVKSNSEEEKNTLNEKSFNDDETEVFLKYIIENYNSLPKVIKFTNDQRENSQNTDPKKIYSNYYFYSQGLGYDTNHLNIFPRDDLGFTRWFKKYICTKHPIDEYIYVTDAPLIVKTPLRKPKEFYENIYNSLKNSAEVKHYVKKSWLYMFN